MSEKVRNLNLYPWSSSNLFKNKARAKELLTMIFSLSRGKLFPHPNLIHGPRYEAFPFIANYLVDLLY